MLEDQIVALAASGGAAVVAAMATDAWQPTREGVARLFRRQGAEVEGRLDEDAALVAAAEDGEAADAARQALAPGWALRLRTLLAAHPEYAEELRTLLPAEGGATRSVQYNIAHDQGRVFGVLDGSTVIHQGQQEA
ncbi:hypothetical protein [Streptomyces roseolus]|uniref:hypothetical protein n=1 Tax=Streptomyces roseolus TaxID=67358 RepID=UPI00167BEAC7|nr:hypothetical protein [Streptomyces roseolus]GGR70202.1 hypothetical protein GCM10010282_73380 [Streptomyces roseolus]